MRDHLQGRPVEQEDCDDHKHRPTPEEGHLVQTRLVPNLVNILAHVDRTQHLLGVILR